MRGVTVHDLGNVLVLHISTHTPHARRDLCQINQNRRAIQFQLTRLMRGVTVHDLGNVLVLHISTHTPHARRD